MSLGRKLKELRVSLKLNQSDIAKFLNVDRSTYGKYETGDSSPDYEKLSNLAKYFEVTTDYLLGNSTVMNPQNQESNYEVPDEFTDPEEARKYIGMHTIFGSGGFRPEKLDDEEIIKFANALLEQMEMVSHKFKK